jgi:hypothetical protein
LKTPESSIKTMYVRGLHLRDGPSGAGIWIDLI